MTSPPGSANLGSLSTIDHASGAGCAVSLDGFIWYRLPEGGFSGIDYRSSRCDKPTTLSSDQSPPIPAWARPNGPTNSIFVATSLEEAYSLEGMQSIDRLAHASGIPVTWLVNNPEYLTGNQPYYNSLHSTYGDDVEAGPSASLNSLASAALPWFSPDILVAGAGPHRDVAAATQLGDSGFWGITWNSHGTDDTSDMGAPWGTYCADPTSYKRPSASGDCSLLSLEWTARDLTRSYFTDTSSQGYSSEAAFSTDPDDILVRAKFSPISGSAYIRELVDAYAAAGQTQAMVMMSQQEAMDEATNGAKDDQVLGAMYAEAAKDGMHAMNMRNAAAEAKTFSAAPRAIAFPFLAGGIETAYNGVPFSPATIDFHDNAAGMTFVSGHTLPSRIFDYSVDTESTFNRPLQETLADATSFPSLRNVALADGRLLFTFESPQATHFGIALWTDATHLGLQGMNVTLAGRAGVVITFDLPAGRSQQSVPCINCSSLIFDYSV